jgi:hypothetical protein
MKNGMILHVYSHTKKGGAVLELLNSLAPGADIKVMPRQKALNPKGPKLNGPGKANETREIIHISGDTSRGQALITLIKAANEKGANGVFISRLTFEETRKKEKAPKDNGPNLAGFDYEGYGIEKPKDMVEPE